VYLPAACSVQLVAVFKKTNSSAMRILKRLQSYCSLFVIRAMLICCVCTPSMVQAQLPGGVYTIDNRLPTSGKNYNSFNAAVIAMLNGITGSVTFNVAAGSGPYNEQVFLDDQIGSSATKLVTFNCNGVTLRFLSTNDLARAGIKISNADYIIIDNLKIEALATTSSEFGWGIHLSDEADHNIIRNCTITVNNNTDMPQNNEGIVINGSDDVATTQGNSYCDSNQIVNNTISGGYTGVTMSSNPSNGQAVLMKGNQVINNKISGYWHAGIYLLYNDGTLLQGNDISRGPIVVPIQYGVTGILMYEGSINTRIIGNRIHNLVNDDPASSSNIDGITITSLATPNAPNIIANNLIYDFKSGGPQFGIKLSGGSYVNVYHNTISLENKAYVGAGGTNGIYTEVWTGLNVMNNIITVSRTTSGSNYGFNMRNTITTFNSDRNLYYISGSTGTNAVGRVGSNSQITLANWQTQTGKDLLSVNSDPLYSDPNNFVLIPTDKNIDNLGLYVGIQNDFAGAIRNNDHPDVGAYEFLTPTCNGAAVGGTTTMLPGSPICEGSPMAMNLTGNSFGVGQTYQWQSSTTINGTYTNVGGALAHPATYITAVNNLYYRVAVTCNTQVDYSVPVAVTVTPSLPSGTYTINSAVATGGKNFQSYNDAVNAIRCGVRGAVVFDVAAGSGPYREQVIIPQINGTSATNTVTFNGNGTKLVYLSTNTNERAILKLNGADYFIFDNINIVPEATSAGSYGVGVQMLNDADHNIIRNCTITMSTSVGLTDLIGINMTPVANGYTSNGSGSLCDSNTITGNTVIGGDIGIYCSTSGNFPTNGNVFTNNTIKDFRTYGFRFANGLNTLVEGNDISRPTRTASFNGFYGIYLDGVQRNLRVSKNRVHDPYGAAKTTNASVTAIYNNNNDAIMAEPVIVSNNLIYNIHCANNQVGIINSSSDSVQYYHNTISLEDSLGNTGSSVTTRAIYISDPTTGIILKNNIIVVNRGGTGTKHCININYVTTTFTSDYNNIVNRSKTGTRNYIGRVNGADYVTVNDWVTNSLNDNNSLNLNPNYFDALNGNFTPTALGLDNKGTPVGITIDINNKTRRLTRPDIGAIEFKVCLLLGPGPNVRVDNETTTSVSFSWDAVTNATGYVVSTDGVNYVQPSSGTTGLTHTITGLVPGTDVPFYVAAMGTADDCDSAKSAKITAHALCSTLGAAPIAKVDTATVAMVQFSWTATPNAAGYKVSTDGINFVTPSGGATGLTHTITTGLIPNSDISLTVQAQGLSELCPKQTSNRVTAHIPGIKYFVPNTFTPNRNGRNDYFTVQSYAVSTMHLMIFNQWGEKVFETSAQKPGWDGTYNGKQQPVGVYVYVLNMTMQDGTVVNKKGTVNLIR
jgi:trimeric autotransporter adhesin